MAAIKTLRQAFLHELSDAYDGEQQLLTAMQEMEGLATHPGVRSGLQRHIKQTRQQVKNLDRVFKLLKAEPEKVTCRGVKGLVAEFKGAAKDMKAPELLDGLIVDAGVKSEHYEIATYHGLIEKARLMQHDGVVELLSENRAMEEQFEWELHQVGEKLGEEPKRRPELVGAAA
jgi:ferritin-like metal-binding protein YciE